MRTCSQRAAAARRRRVPFVVVRTSVSAAGSPAYSLGELPKSKPHGPPLASEHRPVRARERPGLLDLGAAEDAPVAGRERLADRRGGPQDVDDDRDRGRDGLGRREGDPDAHADTLETCPTR